MSRGRTLGDHPVTDLLSLGRQQTGEQLSSHWRRRLAPDEITRGLPGRALAFDARNQPSWLTLAPAHRTEPWRSMRGPDLAIGSIGRETDARHIRPGSGWER